MDFRGLFIRTERGRGRRKRQACGSLASVEQGLGDR